MTHRRLYSPFDLAEVMKEARPLESLSKQDSQTNDDWGWKALAQAAESRLESLAKRVRERGNWSIVEIVPCDCSDCSKLKGFLRDATSDELIWPLAKERRQHIHQIIDGMGIPVSHETLRTGSPHKLVLRKQETLFSQDRQLALAARAALESLAR